MSQNPYDSPTSFTESSKDVKSELNLAGKGDRFVNLIVDNIFLQAISFALGVVIGVASVVSNGGEPTGAAETQMQLVSFFAGLLITIAYFVIMEGAFHRTIGKLITKTKVVSADGSPPSFGQIVGRAFCRFIPFEAISFLVAENGVGWHDSITGTRVVKVD